MFINTAIMFKSIITRRNVLIAAAGWGYVTYNLYRLHYDVDKIRSDYFLDGYRFKFVKNDKFELTSAQLSEYSDKLEDYGDFVRQYLPDMKVGREKSGYDGFAAVSGCVIAVPMYSLFPPSAWEDYKDHIPEGAYELYSNADLNKAALVHEIGHIKNNDYDTAVNIRFAKGTFYTAALVGLARYGCSKLRLSLIAISYISIKCACLYVDRRREYAADEFATRNGYGLELIKSLEISEKIQPMHFDFVKSHPTFPKRIANVRRVMKDIS